ncbi:MAG: dienelactone hydrolase family protein [Actinobacteria bacterium]|nr:dienelactone hydrolase family protein [Actinomycetota bacterium]
MMRLGQIEPADPFPDAGSTDELLAWRERVRGRLDALLGERPRRVPPALETTESVDCGSYRRDRVVFDADPTMSVPAFLLVPHERAAPGPAVLAVHGHGAGKSAICALDLDDGLDAGGRYAHDLASLGYVVLAPDLRCFGERADWNPPDHYACDTNLVSAVMFGVNPLAENLWDMTVALDVLAGDSLVDPQRIGVVGFSYGATVTFFLAAVDERIRAAAVSGYFSSWREAHKMPWNMCGSQVMFDMLGRLEHVDVGALVAPRALLVESATEDLLFPAAEARISLAALAQVYDALGAPSDTVEHHVVGGDHHYDGASVPAFFARNLGSLPAGS